MREAVSVPSVAARKRARGAPPIVMVTAYDTPFARIVDEAGVDIILVGDSVGNNVLGYENSLAVDMGQMIHHVAAVARAKPAALVVGDLPWMSYHVDLADTVRNAAALVRAGARGREARGRATPDPGGPGDPRRRDPGDGPPRAHAPVGPRDGRLRRPGEGREAARAARRRRARPRRGGLLRRGPRRAPRPRGGAGDRGDRRPTIGIGAGPACDGQVLVLHDLLGLSFGPAPKFVRRYADLGTAAREAIAAFARDVVAGSYPSPDETYHASADLRRNLGRPRQHRGLR